MEEIQAVHHKADGWVDVADEVVIGKDILELLSSSMYVDPMTIYREYVQNAVDSIEACRRDNGSAKTGCVDFFVDWVFSRIRIRDDGHGIRKSEFVRRLTAFGASEKRGSSSRGFRGVGRLAGLGYCRELVFRSRAEGETQVSEMTWDCR